MTTPTPAFSLDEQPEVFFTTAETSRQIRALMRAGRVRQLGPRLYTTNLTDSPEDVGRHTWWRIAAGYFPGAVVVDRTALEAAPGADGSITLAASSKREQRVAGLRLRPRMGHGPLHDDRQWMGEDLYFSSQPRAFLENMRPSRAREGLPRTSSTAELGA